MVPPTRRRLLLGAAGLTAALTGCTGLSDQGEQSATRTAGEQPRDPGGGRDTDPETVRIRSGSERVPVWMGQPGDDDGRPRRGERGRHRASGVIDTAERADRIRAADPDARATVRSFLDGTEFGSETVYMETNGVEECYELSLCHVAWSPGQIETDYARRLRPYDEACSADTEIAETWLIRIPAPLDEAQVNSFASSIGSGRCERGRSDPDAQSPPTDTGTDNSTTVREGRSE